MRAIGTAVSLVLAISTAAPTAEAADYRLQPGARVRVQLAGQPSPSIATLVRVSDGELVYEMDGGTRNTVATQSLQSLQVSGGTHGHAKMGALIGGVAGLVLGVAAVSQDEGGDPLFPGEDAAAMAATTGLGALAGTLVGAMIRTEQWTEVGPSAGASLRSSPTLQVGFVIPLR